MAADRSKLERSLDDANAEVARLASIDRPTHFDRDRLSAAQGKARAARRALQQHRNRMEAR